MQPLVSIFLIALCTSLSAQKPAPPIQATAETAMKPTDPFQASIGNSKMSLAKLSEWIDEWEKQLNIEETARTSNLNLSKSNIDRQTRGSINKARDNIKKVALKLDNLNTSDPSKRQMLLIDVQEPVAGLNASIQELHDSILVKGESYAAKSEELKSRHDTVKNSIGNIR